MNQFTILLLEATISIIASLTTMLLLSQPLKESLLDLCPSEKLAKFWLVYTGAMMTISPLLLVLIINGTHRGNIFNDLRAACIAAFSGLLIGLIIIGRKMYLPVDQHAAQSTKEELI